MDKSLRVTLVLSALDKMSRTVDKAVDKSIGKLKDFQKKADKISSSAFDFGKGAAITGAAIAAPLLLAGNAAMEFEDKLADVAKVMNIDVGSTAFHQIGEEAKDLAVYLGKDTTEGAALYASLAQGGTAKAELAEVGKIAGEMAVAFDMAGDVAGDSFSKMKNAMGATIPETKKVVDAINALSDSNAAKASQIVTFMAQGGSGVSRFLGIAGQDVAAFGTSLIAMGKSGEEAATIIQRMQKALLSNDKYKGTYGAAGGGLSGVMAVLEKGSKLQGAAQFAYFKEMGEYAPAIALMAQNIDKVKENLQLTGNSQRYLNSAQKEFENRQSTTKGKLNKSIAELKRVSVDVGATLLPILVDVLKAVAPIIKSVGDWVKKNPELTATLAKMAVVAAGLSFAASGVSFAFGGIVKAAGFLSGGGLGNALKIFKALKFGAFALRYQFVTALIPAITKVGIVMKAFGAALLANPITWYVAAAVALGAAAYLIYKNWDKITGFFKKIWPDVKASFMKILRFIYGPDFMKAGVSIPKMIAKGIMSAITFPVRAILAVVKKVRNYLPFSPAKEGPFKDLHKVKIVETVAESMKPKPLVKAMAQVTGAAAGTVGNMSGLRRAGAAGGSAGGATVINFSPQITITGGATAEQGNQLTAQLKAMILQVMKEQERNKARVSFG